MDELSHVTSVAPTGRISASSLLQESRVLHPSRRGDPIVFGWDKKNPRLKYASQPVAKGYHTVSYDKQRFSGDSQASQN